MRFGWGRFEGDLPKSGWKKTKRVVGIEVRLTKKIHLHRFPRHHPILAKYFGQRGNRRLHEEVERRHVPVMIQGCPIPSVMKRIGSGGRCPQICVGDARSVVPSSKAMVRLSAVTGRVFE